MRRCSRSAIASWLDRIADARDRSRLAPAFGAYRLVTAASVIERWNNDLPGGDPGLFREDGVAELVFDTLAALDPRSGLPAPRAFRCPNGALADLVQVFNGRPLYDPAKADDAGAADTGRARHHVDRDRRATPAGGDRFARQALSGDCARIAFFVYRKESREAI